MLAVHLCHSPDSRRGSPGRECCQRDSSTLPLPHRITSACVYTINKLKIRIHNMAAKIHVHKQFTHQFWLPCSSEWVGHMHHWRRPVSWWEWSHGSLWSSCSDAQQTVETSRELCNADCSPWTSYDHEQPGYPGEREISAMKIKTMCTCTYFSRAVVKVSMVRPPRLETLPAETMITLALHAKERKN